MKKIYTKTVFQFNNKTGSFDLDHAESEFHHVSDDFPIMEMKGGGGGSSGGGRQVVTTEPWAGQAPYIGRGFKEAAGAFLDQPGYIAKFDPATIAAQEGILNASGDTTLSNSARDMINRTLRGDYLYGGEGFNAALNAARNEIIPKVQSSFASRGRTGSGLAQEAEAKAVGDVFASQYGQERQNQLRAGALAPSVDEMKYAGFDRAAGVGSDREKIAEYNANARRNSILKYLGAIQGNYGNTETTTKPETGLSGWRRYLSGGIGGALYGSPYGGWGAAAGGGLGLLGAYL